MSNRHLSRSVVMQTLYELDFRGGSLPLLDGSSDGVTLDEIKKLLSVFADEFAQEVHDVSFMQALILGVLKKRPEIDDIIVKAAPDWPIDKIAILDRNILRIGLYELLFVDRSVVPAKVAINEAIELAKAFGGETSSKFVNGVLGAVYKELGEPEKEHVTNKKEPLKSIHTKTFSVEKICGAVVFARRDNDMYLGLVHDVFGHWTLSKSQYLIGENDEQALVRIVHEELGLSITPGVVLGENEYIASHPTKGKIRKQVKYFLAEAAYQEITLKKTGGGLDDAQWFKLADILNLNFYNDMIPIITKAVTLLLK